MDAELLRKLREALIPGFVVQLDPDEAERVGAFEEEALSVDDALEAAPDLLEHSS